VWLGELRRLDGRKRSATYTFASQAGECERDGCHMQPAFFDPQIFISIRQGGLMALKTRRSLTISQLSER
jgi:hypothetical protein